jgi:copper chaperone CopZ
MLFKVKMCCGKCEAIVQEGVLEVPGVTEVKVDRQASQVAVFGEADPSLVLKKLKKVDWRAKAISVDKKKLQLVSLALAPKPCPLCHPSW